MAIVFGIGSIKIKSFEPHELNLKEKVPDNSKIQLHNTYFHLFWIPFFPLKKQWIGIVDGKKVQFDEKIQSILSSKAQSYRTPLILFIGSALVLLSALSIVGWNSMLIAKGKNYQKNEIQKAYLRINQKVSSPDTFDYYVVTHKNDFNNSILMKVTNASNDSIFFKRIYVKIPSTKIDSLKVGQLIPYIDRSKDSATIAKKLLAKSYYNVYASFLSSETKEGEDLFQDHGIYYLENIYTIKPL